MTQRPDDPMTLLPSAEPLQLIDPDGRATGEKALELPDHDTLIALYRAMVIGRRFDAQVTALTRQGRLAVYPSSSGQEACQVGTALALRERDWLFPTYRDSVAALTRGVPPEELLAGFRGDWHCGFDPYAHRVAPQCTPLATNTPHAVGLAHAARLRGEDTAALVLLGDGATSEGDTHEAMNFAAVWKAPVVFVVQNNGYAISVPLSKQTAAPSFAHKGIGYGIPSRLIDGNDAAAVHAAVTWALATARTSGPVLIEARTYRIGAHTNADDATRYRPADEVDRWSRRDPVRRLKNFLEDARAGEAVPSPSRRAGEETDPVAAEAEKTAARVREWAAREPEPDVAELHTWVLASPGESGPR